LTAVISIKNKNKNTSAIETHFTIARTCLHLWSFESVHAQLQLSWVGL